MAEEFITAQFALADNCNYDNLRDDASKLN